METTYNWKTVIAGLILGLVILPFAIDDCEGTKELDLKPAPKKLVAPICGDDKCDSHKGENTVNCPQDCGDACGDGVCAPTSEDSKNCPFDCGNAETASHEEDGRLWQQGVRARREHGRL